jgi:hypothetical protein
MKTEHKDALSKVEEAYNEMVDEIEKFIQLIDLTLNELSKYNKSFFPNVFTSWNSLVPIAGLLL